jgi:hypothetical protein
MNREFVPYEIALELKQLGFDELCFGWYDGWYETKRLIISPDTSINELNGDIDAPTYSQCFSWFREKYKLGAIVAQFGWGIENELGQIIYDISDGKTPSCYEESELACLKKLIEIIKEKLK